MLHTVLCAGVSIVGIVVIFVFCAALVCSNTTRIENALLGKEKE